MEKKMNAKSTEYFVGLDLGTASVGWAVTNDRYELIHRKGKDLWGTRLFDEAETAEGRRTARTARRRTQRNKARKGVLRSLFETELNELDSGFLGRLKSSSLWAEDREDKKKFSLFGPKGMSDTAFYKKYPTVSHLIMEIINHPDQKPDLRWIYLIGLQKFSHRGNFLQAGLSGEGGSAVENLLAAWQEINEESFSTDLLAGGDKEAVGAMLANKQFRPSQKNEQMVEAYRLKKTKQDDAVTAQQKESIREQVKLICGLTAHLEKVFPDMEGKKSISFRKSVLEDVLSDGEFDSRQVELLEVLHEIYEWVVLSELMTDESGHTYRYLSEARIDLYNKHAEDLNLLKKLMKYAGKTNEMFRDFGPKSESYARYVGSTNSGRGGKQRGKKSPKMLSMDM